MKYMIYVDQNGYKRRALVKDVDTVYDAHKGIPSGPPDPRDMDWDAIKKEINNVLCDSSIFTWDDLQRKPSEFQGALNVLKRHMIALYRQEAQSAKKEQTNG